MNSYALDPCFGDWISWAVLLLLSAGMLGQALWKTPLSRVWRRLPVRLGLLSALAIFILRPTRITSEDLQVTPVVAVLIDGSQSMNATAGQAGETRRALAERVHQRWIAPLLLPLPGRHETWIVNDSLQTLPAAPEKLSPWPAGAGSSALADGLEQLINGDAPTCPGARCDAAIFYTDGSITRGQSWREIVTALPPSAPPVYVIALGDPKSSRTGAFALERIEGPDRVNAGEEARFTVSLRAPDGYTASHTLRLHWRVDGIELSVHELPAPNASAVLTDTQIVPFGETGLKRLSLSVETPTAATAPATTTACPPVLPSEVSHLVVVEAKKIRLLYWSMKLSRQSHQVEEQLARDGVLSVNVAGDYFRAQPINVDNALRSADVLVWEDPDLSRLTPATLAVLDSRLREGMGLVLVSSPRLQLSADALLLSSLPSQAGAPWQAVKTLPVVPAELRKGTFWSEQASALPPLTGRLQGFDPPRDLGGYQAVITTAEGQPVLLAGHPAANLSVAVLLTADWPGDEEAGQLTPPAIGLGRLIRHAVHWAAGLNARPGEPALHVRLSNDRPLPDQAVQGEIECNNLDTGAITATQLKLELLEFSSAPTAPATPPSPPQPPAPAPASGQPIDWQRVNGQIRFRLVAHNSGLFVAQATYRDTARTLIDRAPLYVAGQELEATLPPDHDGLNLLAQATHGKFIDAAHAQDSDFQTIAADLKTRLTPQPAQQIGRKSLGGGGLLSALVIVFLLIEMTLRARRLW